MPDHKTREKSSDPGFLAGRLNRQRGHIIEVKDGHDFDTKKSRAEVENMNRWKSAVDQRVAAFETKVIICCFNQPSREEIVKGFKSHIKEEEAMTGQELCDLLKLNYHNILKERKKGQIDSRDFVLREFGQLWRELSTQEQERLSQPTKLFD